ncbi:MAG: SpoIIE family protein phosphatase [candidate division KSB1 bacterium]|nr:SpoIIE family protein phosphatase [candidate division KSB1 bacterium]
MEISSLFRQSSIGTALAGLAQTLRVGLSIRNGDGEVLFSSPSSTQPRSQRQIRGLSCLGKQVGSLELTAPDELPSGLVAEIAEAIGKILEDRLYAEHEIASLAAEVADRYEEIHLLSNLSAALGSVFDVRRVCETALQFALRAVPARRASILVYDEAEQVLRVAAQCGMPAEVAREVRVRPGEGICGRVFEQGTPLLVADREQLEQLGQDRPPRGTYSTDSFLSVPLLASPLQVQGRKIGVFNLADRVDGGAFTTSDLKTLTTIASVTAIALYNCQLVDQVRATEAFQKEMEIAKNIQLSLLPKSWPQVPGGSVAGLYQPARVIGGDYYDFYCDETSLLSLAIADVSGHDIGAALLMIEARSVIRSEMSRWRDPAEVLHGTNRTLYPDLESGGLFISAFCARLDPTTWVLEYANAGHCLPIWVEGRTGEVRRLDAEGMIIGIWPEINFEKREIQLQPGDLVVLFTDGATEAKSPTGEPFGEDRLAELASRYREEDPAQLTSILHESLRTFTGNAEFVDDITVVVLKRL